MFTEEMKQALSSFCAKVLWNEPLSRHTTVRVGGPADALLFPQKIDDLTETVRYCRRKNLPYFVMGAGSNLVVRDKGIRGVVLHLGEGFSNFRVDHEEEGKVILYAEAGVGVPRLIDGTAEQGLTGLEPLAGIPGNLGGVLSMNAGTPEGSVSDHLLTVTFMDKEGKLVTWKPDQIRFGYRESHFPRGAILLSARFELKRSTPEEVRQRVAALRERRVQTQPLNVPNVGSVFKNPEGKFAGALIEEAGLKNVRVGGARVSPKHANFILNEIRGETGGATAREVIALIGLVRDKVKEKFGVLLEPEVKIVGEE